MLYVVQRVGKERQPSRPGMLIILEQWGLTSEHRNGDCVSGLAHHRSGLVSQPALPTQSTLEGVFESGQELCAGRDCVSGEESPERSITPDGRQLEPLCDL